MFARFSDIGKKTAKPKICIELGDSPTVELWGKNIKSYVRDKEKNRRNAWKEFALFYSEVGIRYSYINAKLYFFKLWLCFFLRFYWLRLSFCLFLSSAPPSFLFKFVLTGSFLTELITLSRMTLLTKLSENRSKYSSFHCVSRSYSVFI